MWLQHLTAFSLSPAGFTIYTGLLPVIQTLLKSFLTLIQTGNSSLWGVNLCLLSDTMDTMNTVQLDQRERGQRKEERKENEFYRYIKTINFHHAVFLLCYEYYTAHSPTVGLLGFHSALSYTQSFKAGRRYEDTRGAHFQRYCHYLSPSCCCSCLKGRGASNIQFLQSQSSIEDRWYTKQILNFMHTWTIYTTNDKVSYSLYNRLPRHIWLL